MALSGIGNLPSEKFRNDFSLTIIQVAAEADILAIDFSKPSLLLSEVECATSGKFIKEIVPPHVSVVLTSEIESNEKYSGALEDYRSYISKFGVNFRSLLSVKKSLSAWWLLSFTEKAIDSDPVVFFRIVRALQSVVTFIETRDAKSPCEVNWIGSDEGSLLVQSWIDRRGLSLKIRKIRKPSLQDVARAEIYSPPRRNRLQWITKLFCIRRPQSAELLLISDYPDSWSSSPVSSPDRYLGDLTPWLHERYKERFKHCIFQRATPNALKRFEDSRLEIIDQWGTLWDMILSKYLTRRWYKKISAIDFSPFSPEYCGADFSSYFKTKLLAELKNSLPYKLFSIRALERYLRLSKTKKVIFRNEFYISGRMITWACVLTSVASLSFQHGVFGAKHGVYSFGGEELEGPFSFPLPNIFVVWGSWFRNFLVDRYRYPSGKIESWGGHRLLIGRVDSQISLRQNDHSNTGRVLFALQDEFTPVEIVFEALKTMPCPPVLVLKTHHQTDVLRHIRTIQNRYPTVLSTVEFGSLQALMVKCDALITGYSTSALEALFSKIPVFYVQLPQSKGSVPFNIFSDIAIPVTTPQDFVRGWEMLKNKKTGGHDLRQIETKLESFYESLDAWVRS